jgi:hypothetical protein
MLHKPLSKLDTALNGERLAYEYDAYLKRESKQIIFLVWEGETRGGKELLTPMFFEDWKEPLREYKRYLFLRADSRRRRDGLPCLNPEAFGI